MSTDGGGASATSVSGGSFNSGVSGGSTGDASAGSDGSASGAGGADSSGSGTDGALSGSSNPTGANNSSSGSSDSDASSGSSGSEASPGAGLGTDTNTSSGDDSVPADSSSSPGSGGSGSTPGKPVKTELSNINSASDLVSEKVIKYLNAIITGNDGRTSLIPSAGFFNSATTEKKYGITPDCTSSNGSVNCKKADSSNTIPTENNETGNNNTYNHGYYFEVTQGSQNNIYTYTYEAYRANITDFYITGEIQATVHNTNVELKGQVRIHSSFKDASNSADDVIIVKFGKGNVDSNDSDDVSLDTSNVPESGKLTITLTKGGASSTILEKEYDLHTSTRNSKLTSDDKKVINNLGLFTIN